MNKYLSSASLKALAKGQLLGNFGILIRIFLIYCGWVFFTTFSTSMMDISSFMGLIIYYVATFLISLITGIFLYGQAYIFLKIACNQEIMVSDLFFGFKNAPDRIIKVQAVISLVSLLCSFYGILSPYVIQQPDNSYLFLAYVVLFILGSAVNILFTLNASQCFYLMLDFPQYSPSEIFKKSFSIMKGSKGRLFYISLSFLPLFLLGICSCCIGFLWVLPYLQAVHANFYLDLIKKKQ